MGASFRVDLPDELYRHAHSLRGMSAAMDFPEIVALAHAVENLLGELRARPAPLPAAAGRRIGEASALLQQMIGARGRGAIAAGDPGLLVALGEAAFETGGPAVDS
jgi:two-component system chemotaxis sensor kinase CheA